MFESIRDYFYRKAEERHIRREEIRQSLIPEKFILVTTLHEDFNFKGEKEIFRFYYKCYESNKGNRKIEFACTKSGLACSFEFIANQRNFYQEKILRWKEGRYDPDIPRHDQISEEDVANALKGTL
jgi:hypothetical protein